MKNYPSSTPPLVKIAVTFLVIFLTFFWVPAVILAQDPAPQPTAPEEAPAEQAPAAPIIRLISPAEGSQVIGKKPEIRFALLDPANVQSLTVFLDGTDITAIVKQEGAEYVFKPIQALPAGQHALQIAAKSSDGQDLSQEAAFQSRHSKEFEEAYSNNDIGLVYRERLAKSNHLQTEQDYRFDANLSSNSKVKEGGFESSFTTNLRYMTQEFAVTEPEKKWLNLVNYLWQTKYEKNKFSAATDVGDLSIDETPLTAQGLARRGGKLGLTYGDYEVHGFVVKNKELYGFEGGMGIEGPTSDHLMGTSASAGFFDKNLLLKGTHIVGGQKAESYGTWSEMTLTRGYVSSGNMQVSLFEKKVQLEGEYAEAKFDADTSDIYVPEEDKAYNYGFNGVYDIYSLKGRYEYLGPKYHSIANPSLQNNLKGYNLESAAGFKTQMLSLGFSEYRDNVENDPLYPVMTTTHGLTNYSFSGVTNLTVGVGYDQSVGKSSQEPAGTAEVRTYTTTYNGNISYIMGPLNLGLTGSTSAQDDRTTADLDTETKSWAFTPTLTLNYLTVTPSYAFNTTWDKSTNLTTDTRTMGLNLSGHLFEKHILYDLAGTHNHIETSDRSSEQGTLSASYKLTYVITEKFWGFVNPSIAIEGRYGSTHDYINDTRSHEKVVFLVLSTNLPANF